VVGVSEQGERQAAGAGGGLEGPAPEERPRPDGRRTGQGIRVDPEVEAEHEPRRTVLSALVFHEPGVLAEISGLLGRRQFNIESLTVGPTVDDDLARITLVIEEPDPGIDQAKKQLAKLVDVVSVTELGEDSTHREMALLKLDADHPDRVQAVAEMHGGCVVDVSREAITVEVTGPEEEIDSAVETFRQFTVREIARTGTSALARGAGETADRERLERVKERLAGEHP
jgi:acetolactate synthase-1/3 small subunit